MKTAIISTTFKDQEKRVPIHPKQIQNISPEIRQELYFETGYGVPFGVSDDEITSLTGNQTVSRNVLISEFPNVIITKPVQKDFEEMSNGGTVWGWIHSVEQRTVTQTAIDKKLTLIAWENMYYHNERGQVHIFQKNNEMAGYCGVQHALQLQGIDGNFGPERSAVILGFGSVSRGALNALKGHGINNISVISTRPSQLIIDQIPGVKYLQMEKQADGNFALKESNGEWTPLINELVKADIIVNGVLQDPDDPLIFVHQDEVACFTKECLIVDISCDEKMGFSFAIPTDFSHPITTIGNIHYYSVDNVPALLWNSATWEISNALLPFLADYVHRKSNSILSAATDIKNGVVMNPKIFSYQKRSIDYPFNITMNV